MKTVKFEGQEYEVPEWCHWMARDEGGQVYAFEIQPYLNQATFRTESGNVCEVTPTIPDWRESKVKV